MQLSTLHVGNLVLPIMRNIVSEHNIKSLR